MPGKQSFEQREVDKAPVAEENSLSKNAIVDYGVPDPFIYLARDHSALHDTNSSWLRLGNEQHVIPPRREYQPIATMKTRNARDMTRRLLKSKEFALLTGSFLEKELLEDNASDRLVNHYDPYKSNLLVIGKVQGRHFWIGPAGENSSQLAITLVEGSTTAQFTDLAGKTWQCNNIPQGRLDPRTVLTFSFPIVQLSLSTARTADDHEVVVGVRTLDGSSLLSIRITEHKNRTIVKTSLLHRFISQEYGISRLTSMAMSPFRHNEYAVIDDTGHVVFFDCRSGSASFDKSGIIGEHDPSLSPPRQRLHGDNWHAITFGPHPRIVIVACPEKVEVLDLRQRIGPTGDTEAHDDPDAGALNSPPIAHPKSFQSRTLYTPSRDARIYALSSPGTPHRFQCCIVTTSHVLLMDTRYPFRPVITWAHHMDDNPPVSLEFQQGAKNRIRVFAWAPHNDMVLALSYCYNERAPFSNWALQRPASQSATFSLPETIALDPYLFRQMAGTNPIPTVGLKLLSRVARCGTKTSMVIVVHRLFEDSALHLQPCVYADDLHTPWTQVHFPQLTLEDPEAQRARERDEAEERSKWTWKWQPRSLVKSLITEYLSVDFSLRPPCKSATLNTDQVKDIVHRAKQTTYPVTLHDLVNEGEELTFDKAATESIDTLLKHYLEPLPADTLPFGERPCAPEASSADPEAGDEGPGDSKNPESTKWEELLTRELLTSQLTYMPLRTDSDDTKLRYLQFANDRFTLTPTTQLLAQEWPLGLGKGESLTYGQRDAKVLFPWGHKKRRHSVAFEGILKLEREEEPLPPSVAPAVKLSLSSQPTLYNSPKTPSFTEISSQPVPGVFANRTPTKKKKKKKVLGFK